MCVHGVVKTSSIEGRGGVVVLSTLSSGGDGFDSPSTVSA